MASAPVGVVLEVAGRGAVGADGELADMIGAAADALCSHHVAEHGRGLEGGDVTAGVPVPHRVAVLVDVVLGEEHGELDLAGACPSVLALSSRPAVSFAVMVTPVPSIAP